MSTPMPEMGALLTSSGIQVKIKQSQSQSQRKQDLFHQLQTLPRQELPVCSFVCRAGLADNTVEHHEVASHTSEHSARSPSSLKSPPLPARPQRLPRSPEPEPPQPITFGDKNPFRNTTTTTTPLNPFHQSKIPAQAEPQEEDEESSEDEDEALQRALAMSVDPSMEVDPPSYDDGRADRERSIRATAPPPSPTEKRGQLIGPINQESRAQSPSPAGQREEGNGNSLALMPSSMTEVSTSNVFFQRPMLS